MKVTRKEIQLKASAKAVITQFLFLPGSNRVTNVIRRMEKFTEQEVEANFQKVLKDFGRRHRNIEQIFLDHFNRIEDQFGSSLSHFSPIAKMLLGAYFTKEYSIQAAALFNPSIVPHPDQQNLQAGEQRFIMSLRATGEGHISSIVFQTGIVDGDGNISLDASSGYYTCLKKNSHVPYSKEFILKCATSVSGFNKAVLDHFPDSFTEEQAHLILKSLVADNAALKDSVLVLEQILDSNYELEASSHLPVNERVIFPNAKAEQMGMEDVRLVKFEEGNENCYYGTYTAYDGSRIKTQLIETKDFRVFRIRTLYGGAISDKGMALFPEKVNGKYVMISRQGGEKISIMYSGDLYHWENYQVLLEPLFDWELVQAGNCGSPIKTDKGWLLLTHGVGAMRTYVISAILLDLQNPSSVVARLQTPLIAADENEREGYVPNVVYTCGLMLHGKKLIVPFAVSDSATAFASVVLDELLREMKH